MHRHTRAIGLPVLHRFVQAERRAVAAGQFKVSRDTLFRKQDSRARLPNRCHVRLRAKCGEAAVNFFARKDFVRQMVGLRAEFGAAEDHTITRTDHQTAGREQEFLPGLLLQFRPQLIRALHQRNVKGVFKVGLADDAGLSVRRTERMRGREPVQSEHPAAAAGEVICRRAAHGAHSHHDHIMRARHRGRRIRKFVAAVE